MDNLSLNGVSPTLSLSAYAVLALPFLSFLLNGLGLRRYPRAAGWSATFLIGLSFVMALALTLGWKQEVLGNPSLFPHGAALAFDHLWVGFGPHLSARFGYYLDSISIMMTLVITGISFLVHFYSMGYMHGDRSEGRFFSLLSLFTFTMLGLVAAANIVQTFFFWELVGASSYLLIGFWYEKPSAVAASKKAFIITRLADGFFLAGLLLAGLQVQSFDISQFNSVNGIGFLNHEIVVAGFSFNLLFVTCLLLFAGAWGKSAMFPLHVWLPDAMEGPTPVSSLIHSATMVVAGIYLTARLFPLFSANASMLQVVETVGLVTALFGAIVACTQTDLKRILAFSTLSQLGYMMFALGVGGQGEYGSMGFSASMFHVFTHAFFKCLLFLSAGIVIHSIHSQELKDAGGLKEKLPWTYFATLIACLAISGVWPFAGFFSKDEILLTALSNGHYCTFSLALLTGGLTAFYMFRYFFVIFHGSSSTHDQEKHSGPGESWIMVLPVVVLAIPSMLAGFAKETFLTWVKPFGTPIGFASETSPHHFVWLPYLAMSVALIGIFVAYFRYGFMRTSPGETPSSPFLYRLISRKFYLDEAWMAFARQGIFSGIVRPLAYLEKVIVNGAFDLLGYFARVGSSLASAAQNGRLQLYSGVGLVGLCLLYLIGKAVS